MGVDVTSYVMYGIKFNFDLALWENEDFHEKYIISDGMSGDYMVLGLILSSLDKWDEDFNYIGLNFGDLNTQTEILKNLFLETYPTKASLIEGKPFQLMAFNHYS